MSKCEAPNKSRRVRNKRIRKTEYESNDDSASENECDLVLPTDELFIKQNNKKSVKPTEDDKDFKRDRNEKKTDNNEKIDGNDEERIHVDNN